MTSAIVDTLQCAEYFRDHGFTDQESKALAGKLGEVANSHMVTREHLDSQLIATREHWDNQLIATREHWDNQLTATREYLDTQLTVTRDYLDSQLAATRDYVDSKFENIDAKFERVDARFKETREYIDFRLNELQSKLTISLGAWIAAVISFFKIMEHFF